MGLGRERGPETRRWNSAGSRVEKRGKTRGALHARCVGRGRRAWHWLRACRPLDEADMPPKEKEPLGACLRGGLHGAQLYRNAHILTCVPFQRGTPLVLLKGSRLPAMDSRAVISPLPFARPTSYSYSFTASALVCKADRHWRTNPARPAATLATAGPCPCILPSHVAPLPIWAL